MLKKAKIFMSAFLIIILSLPSFTVFGFSNTTDLGLKSKSAILMEATTGEVLYEHNSDQALPPASVTKVMTLLLIYEAVESGRIKWDDVVTVSEHAASMGGSQVFLEATEQQTVATMTKCISIASANDASVAMAEYIGGSEQGFIEMMNKRADELGMENTNFVNACGLDADGHETSARDIAIMSRELITRFPEVSENATTWMDTIIHKTRSGEKEFGLTNTNKLVKWYNGATGLKTGSTSKALFCLSGTATKDEMDLVAVVMGGPSSAIRFQEVMQMLDYGFANFEVINGDEVDSVLCDVVVYKGAEETMPIAVKEQVNVVCPKGTESELTTETVVYESISAPFNQGEKAGEVIYSLNGIEVGRSDLVTTESMEQIGVSGMFGRIICKWFG